MNREEIESEAIRLEQMAVDDQSEAVAEELHSLSLGIHDSSPSVPCTQLTYPAGID